MIAIILFTFCALCAIEKSIIIANCPSILSLRDKSLTMESSKKLNIKTNNMSPVRNYDNVITLKPRREIVIEEIQTEFDKQLDKIALINDFMALHCKKSEIKDDLAVLKKTTVELRGFFNIAREKIQFFKSAQMPLTNRLIENMRKQHLKMLEMLEELDNSEKDVCSLRVTSADKNNVSPTPLAETSKPQNRQTFLLAPRINTIAPTLHQAPFGLRVNPRAICKLSKQFQINIDPIEFDKIPKYMKGRYTIDELQTFLETVIIKCFIDKYSLLNQDRENVQPIQMTLWKIYRIQMEYFPGEMFITEDDILYLIGKMMDKKMIHRIAILRHLHMIQENRHGTTTCFIWKGKK